MFTILPSREPYKLKIILLMKLSIISIVSSVVLLALAILRLDPNWFDSGTTTFLQEENARHFTLVLIVVSAIQVIISLFSFAAAAELLRTSSSNGNGVSKSMTSTCNDQRTHSLGTQNDISKYSLYHLQSTTASNAGRCISSAPYYDVASEQVYLNTSLKPQPPRDSDVKCIIFGIH